MPVLLLRVCREGETDTIRVAVFWQDYLLPNNVVATTSAAEACAGAQYAIHAVPVQHSRAFLHAIKVHTAREEHSRLLPSCCCLAMRRRYPAFGSIWRMLSRTCNLRCAACHPADACHIRKADFHF